MKPTTVIINPRKSSAGSDSSTTSIKLSSSIQLHQIDFGRVIASMKSGLHICDRTWWFKTYKQCFIGSECVTWLVNNQNKICETREDALTLCNYLVSHKYIRHVKNKAKFKDDYLFYVFTTARKTPHNRSYSLSHVIHTNDTRNIRATMGITSHQLRKPRMQRAHSHSVETCTTTHPLSTHCPTENPDGAQDNRPITLSQLYGNQRIKFFPLCDLTMGPLNDGEAGSANTLKVTALSHTRSAPVVDTNATKIKFRAFASVDLLSTATDVQDEFSIDGLTDDDEYQRDLFKYYYHGIYSSYVPKTEYVQSNTDIALDHAAPVECYLLPKYLSTNVYSMTTVPYSQEKEIVFVASTGYRKHWVYHVQDGPPMYSANIYAYVEDEWCNIKWDHVLYQYVSAVNAPIILHHVSIINIDSIVIDDVFSVFCVLWSNEIQHYLSTFYWPTNEMLTTDILSLFGVHNHSVIELDFVPFCIHSAPLLFGSKPFVFVGGNDGVHSFECIRINDTIRVREVTDTSAMPLVEFSTVEHAVLVMDSHRFDGSDTLFAIIGCSDGYIKMVQKIRSLESNWKTYRMFTKRINGAVSSLLFYVKPNIFDYYVINYGDDIFLEEEEDEEEDEKAMEKELLNSLCLFIGSCTGYSMTYSSLFDNGFINANREWFGDHILYSIDCCDSVLCCEYFVMKGCLYLLFGCYSGKLLCYKLNNLSSPSSFTLMFECQFDQQIHRIASTQNTKDSECCEMDGAIEDRKCIVVMTMNKIYILSLKLLKRSLVIDESKIVSV